MENRFFGFVDINDDSSSSFAFVAVPCYIAIAVV
jgi:hypothetical protein